MHLQDPYTPPVSSDSSPDNESQAVSHTEFYGERVMTQEIEALTIISNTQEIAAVTLDDTATRA